MRRTLVSSSVLLCGLAIFMPGVATASPPLCTGDLVQSTIFEGQGQLESVIVGNGGKLFYSGTPTGSQTSRLFSSSRPGAAPKVVTDGPAGPGGLAWNNRKLLWGYGNTFPNGSTGDLAPKAGLYRVDPVTGAKTVVSDHLGMANGVATAADGTIYASNALGQKLDRIKKGVTLNGWATASNANGLVVGRNQRFLYANLSLSTPSTIAMIDTTDPSRVLTYFTSTEPGNVFLDGLARDGQNNLYAAALASGEIWKITPKKEVCVVATGLKQPSAVAISSARKGYSAGNLYAVGYGGEVTEVKMGK